MKGLAGNEVSDKLLKTLWLDKLPQHIRSILVISDGDVTKLADIGDHIWDIKPNNSAVEVNTASAKYESTTKKTNDSRRLILFIKERNQRKL